METDVVISIIIVVVVLLTFVWLVASRLRAREARRRIRRDKLSSVADGHHEMVIAHEGSLEELQSQAHVHRAAAADHTDELEQRVEREHRQAQFHEQREAV